MKSALSLTVAILPFALAAQAPATLYPPPHLPPPDGYRVFIIPDMEGMGSVVNIHEVIAGIEGKNYVDLTGPDYWQRSRSLMTQEVNAVIRGSRGAGARSFVVNEGHGGNLFANIIPEELDTGALLIRGFPKPLIMITGIDSSVGTVIFTGAHAGPGHPGVLAHNYSKTTSRSTGMSSTKWGSTLSSRANSASGSRWSRAMTARSRSAGKSSATSSSG